VHAGAGPTGVKGFKLTLDKGATVLEGLLKNGIALEHECGGMLACGSCRVVVREGLENLAPADEDEQDMLDRAGASTPGARLACQATARGGDIVIEVPYRITSDTAPVCQSRSPIALSEGAAKHLAAQLAKRPGSAVRLSVRRSGCSGLRYRVDHEHSIGAYDAVFESRGVRLVIDADSLPYLQGTRLDVVQEGLARHLRFDNPNARESCGCGQSFAA